MQVGNAALVQAVGDTLNLRHWRVQNEMDMFTRCNEDDVANPILLSNLHRLLLKYKLTKALRT